MGVLAGAANLYFLYKFIKILTTPWEQSDAYKLGIVDENGKILIKKNKLKGSEQKEAYTMMHRFVWKMKRLMEKIPFGKSRLASYAAALWFIKEQNNFSDDSDDQLIQESFLSFLETDWKNDALILKENYEGDMDKKTFEDLHEGLKDLPPHLQKLVKKIEKRQKDWNKQNPTAKVKTLVYNPKTGKPDIEIEEKAPPGWEKTVKKMKKNKEIDNPYALAWYMANKGDKPEEWENHTIGEKMLSFSNFNESTKEYAKSLKKMANDRALKMLSKSERENLKKIADLLDREKKEEYQKKPFAERIFEAAVLDVNDVDKWVSEIKKGIKAGWVSVGSSTLGGDKNVAILIKLTLETEKDWPHKILQNATYGMIRIGTDGTMEMFASDRKVKNMRKTRIKSAKDVVSKINTWIKQVDEDVVLDEKKSDYEDEISAFKKKGGKVKKMKPGKSFKSFFKQKGPKKPPRQEEVEITEVLKSKDKSVIDAFYDKDSLVGRLLSTNGRSLQKHGMGGQTIAAWLKGKIAIVAVSDVKSTESILRYMKNSIPKLNFDPKSYKKFFEEVELDEKWEVGVVYHQDFGGGEISYFRADALLKNKRWKGMAVDEYSGKQRKPKNITADEKTPGWEITPKNKIPKGLKEEVEIDEEVFNWYIIKGNKEKGKVAHVGTERQLKLKIRKPTFPPNHVLAKSRKDLRIGDKWKGSMGVSEEIELEEMPNRANMEKINSLIKKYSGKFKWRDEVLYVDKRIEKNVTSLIKKGGLTATIKVSSDPMKEGFTTFTSYLNEGRPAGKIRDDENTPTNIERQKLVDSQEKNYTLKDIENIARKHKVRLHPLEHPMKFGSEWTIITDKNIKLIYNKRRNDTLVTGWRIDKKKLRQYKDKYENEETRIQDVEAGIGGGRLSFRGFESAFEVISEQLNEEAPANATGTAVVGTGDDTTVWKKKKIRKNAKVETEEFGGKKVFVVSSDKFYNARMGKSRYSRYEKYVGNDKLGETIRQYGRENPKSPIILKNSDTGAMLYLKYGTRV